MKDFYTYTDLIKKLGLARSLVETFIDPPDNTIPNEKHPNWAYIKLYDAGRVNRLSYNPDFCEAFLKLIEKRSKRKNKQVG